MLSEGEEAECQRQPFHRERNLENAGKYQASLQRGSGVARGVDIPSILVIGLSVAQGVQTEKLSVDIVFNVDWPLMKCRQVSEEQVNYLAI